MDRLARLLLAARVVRHAAFGIDVLLNGACLVQLLSDFELSHPWPMFHEVQYVWGRSLRHRNLTGSTNTLAERLESRHELNS